MKKILLLFAMAFSVCDYILADDGKRDMIVLPPIESEVLIQAIKDAGIIQQVDNRDFILAQFLSNEAKKFRTGDLGMMRNMMAEMSDSQLAAVTGENFKDPTTALILSILTGSLGVDRFYIGDTGQGIGKLLTLGGLGVWTIIDWFHIQERTKVKNYKEFEKSVNTSKLFLQ